MPAGCLELGVGVVLRGKGLILRTCLAGDPA